MTNKTVEIISHDILSEKRVCVDVSFDVKGGGGALLAFNPN